MMKTPKEFNVIDRTEMKRSYDIDDFSGEHTIRNTCITIDVDSHGHWYVSDARDEIKCGPYATSYDALIGWVVDV